MEKLLNKGHLGVVAQFNSIQVLEEPTLDIYHDLQLILTKYQQAFETLNGLPPSMGEHDHLVSP